MREPLVRTKGPGEGGMSDSIHLFINGILLICRSRKVSERGDAGGG